MWLYVFLAVVGLAAVSFFAYVLGLAKGEVDTWESAHEHYKKEFQKKIIPKLTWWDAAELIYTFCGLEEEYKRDFGKFRNDMLPKDGCWPIPVTRGLNLLKILEIFDRLGIPLIFFFDFSLIDDDLEQRSPSGGSYLIRVRASFSPDEENVNQSPMDREKRGCQDMTLLEYLLLVLLIALTQKGKILDSGVGEATQCSGSRIEKSEWVAGKCNRRRDVPVVSPNGPGGVDVTGWYGEDIAMPLGGSRSVLEVVVIEDAAA